MTAGKVRGTLRVSGRLVVNPTQEFAGGTYPYGGTEVGKTMDVRLLSLGSNYHVHYEGLGETGAVLNKPNRFTLEMTIRGWDDDAVAEFLRDGYEVGEQTRHAVYSEPGFATPGATAMQRALTLVYVPDDHINVPGLLVYNGIPDWKESTELAFQRKSELGIHLQIACLRDDYGSIYRIGRLADLTLT